MSDDLLPQRVTSKINHSTGSDCWEWAASTNACGYGRVWWEGANRLAHRVVYELIRGPIPPGLTLDHLCRVRHCVNPAHLEPVTGSENTRRGNVPSVVAARTGLCVAGRHPLSGENVGFQSGGKRYCRACKAEHSRRRKAA